MVFASHLYNGTANSSPAQRLRTGTAADVREALLAIRARTLALMDDYLAALGADCAVPQRAGLNPPLWEWGHVAWFAEFWLARNPERARGAACDIAAPWGAASWAKADACFDSSHVAHASRWNLPLPGPDSTRALLAEGLAHTLDLLAALPPDAGDDALYFFRLAALHEAMHAEAAVYMAQALGFAMRTPHAHEFATTLMLHVPAQTRTLGSSAGGFAFDNELSAQPVQLAEFEIDSQSVSWLRYVPFIEAGGYQNPAHWTPEGWAWLAESGLQAPLYLRCESGAWQEQRFGRWQALGDSAAACHLSLHEAAAWCAWAGRRLPTEAEWECAAAAAPGFGWGSVWEWTASKFAPYPGFVAHPYRDYSQPWFGSHQVLRGASPATSPWLAHVRYRNFFEAHRNDVAAGFRSCAV